MAENNLFCKYRFKAYVLHAPKDYKGIMDINAGFNIKIAGTTQGSGQILSYKQSLAKDTTAETGSIITVYFRSSETISD